MSIAKLGKTFARKTLQVGSKQDRFSADRTTSSLMRDYVQLLPRPLRQKGRHSDAKQFSGD